MIQSDTELERLQEYLSKSRKNNNNSKLALKNKYVFFGNFDAISFEDNFDWNYKHNHSPNTYQVYMHTLNIVGNLTNSYIDTKNKKYIKKANNILFDWMDSESNKYENNKNASWKDHSVSSRVKNLLLYQISAPKYLKLNENVLGPQLKLHGEYLSDRAHYSENNHGMMSDEALLLVSNFIETPETANRFKEIATLRMERMIYKLFSSMSMNLENSPEYHRMTQILTKNFINLTEIMNIEFDQRCKDIVEQSEKLNSSLIKPDKTYPLIGDTGYKKFNIEKSFDNLIDYQAGLAIINSPNQSKDSDSSWLSFKSGYVTKSHKQFDDLSINYYHNGEDILVDSGKYNYDRRDPMKQYVKSPKAHSTIFFKEETYELGNPIEEYNDMRLKFVKETSEFVHLAATNHLYNNMFIWRDVIYLESKGLIIVDRYKAESPRLMAQNFNFHEGLTIESRGNNEFGVSTPTGKELILKEHTSRTLNRYYPHDHKERGFISRKFSEFIETQQIEYLKKSFKNQFITTIHEPQKIDIQSITEENGTLLISVDGRPHKIYLQN